VQGDAVQSEHVGVLAVLSVSMQGDTLSPWCVVPAGMAMIQGGARLLYSWVLLSVHAHRYMCMRFEGHCYNYAGV
jgi:hypothetical protein